MQTAAVFRQKSCCGSQSQTPRGESEGSHESGRTNYTYGGSDCCAIDFGLLLTFCLCGSTGIGGGECQVAVSTSLVAAECRCAASCRLCSVIREAEPVPKTQPA